ncbi:MAG: DUF1735 domain-containing protein [Bacteroidales bacterium]|nr:DUF1735 domain-containing protein [Bacteroidales bacterium]
MKLNKNVFLLAIIIGLFMSCEQENPLENEQYIKEVYIVGAYDVVKKFDVPYGDEPQSAYISVATSGSLNIDQDVDVTLTDNPSTIDWYNNKYMIDSPVKYRELESEYYDFPSMATTIKAGDVYSRLPFYIKSSGLHCDSLYALTFKIESVSTYSKNTKDTVLIMNLNFVNEFSGTYQMTATKFTLDSEGDELMPTSMNLLRAVKAVDKDQVRFINEALSEPSLTLSTEEYFKFIDDNCVVFSHQMDGTFSVLGWKNLNVFNGTASFADDKFEFSYDYEFRGEKFRLRGTMTK